MVQTAERTVKTIIALRRLETRMEEAHDTYATALTELRRAERQGRWEDAREWRGELEGVERDICKLQSQIDDLSEQDEPSGFGRDITEYRYQYGR